MHRQAEQRCPGRSQQDHDHALGNGEEIHSLVPIAAQDILHDGVFLKETVDSENGYDHIQDEQFTGDPDQRKQLLFRIFIIPCDPPVVPARRRHDGRYEAAGRQSDIEDRCFPCFLRLFRAHGSVEQFILIPGQGDGQGEHQSEQKTGERSQQGNAQACGIQLSVRGRNADICFFLRTYIQEPGVPAQLRIGVIVFAAERIAGDTEGRCRAGNLVCIR